MSALVQVPSHRSEANTMFHALREQTKHIADKILICQLSPLMQQCEIKMAALSVGGSNNKLQNKI